MENIFFDWNTIIRKYLLSFSFFLLISQISLAAVDPSTFTVTATIGNCSANASVKVTLPTGNYNSGWIAHIWKGTFTSELPVPITGGDIVFNSLAPGTYSVELKDSFITLAPKTILVSTTYIALTVTNSFKVPTCKPSSAGYDPKNPNGELTVGVPTGGIGPFQFDVIYPTSATNATLLSQTFTGTTNTYRTHVFTGMPGGITPTITVTDLANDVAGCGQSKTQNPTLPNNTSGNVAYGFRSYNFVRTIDCVNPKLYINLDNVTAERDAIISVPGNATITIAGVAYNLTRISAGRWTYDPIAAGGPPLTNGMPITTKFYWGCSTLQRSTWVLAGNTFLGLSQEVKVNNSCGMDYTMVIFGDQDSTPDGLTDRNIYFLEKNNLKFEKLVDGVWQVVPNYEITPNPATLGTNPMGVNGAYTASIPSVSSRYTFNSPGTYKCTAWDDCHSVTNTITFKEVVPIDKLSVTKENYGVLQGTSGFKVALGITLKANLTIKVSRADGQTSIPMTATGPLNMGGDYVANFPQTRVISTPNINNTYLFSDMPLGEYIIELSDNCNNSRTVNVTLDNPAGYTPVITPIVGCTGSNKINYNLGANSYAYTSGDPSIRLYKDNGAGEPGGSVLQTNTTINGTFNNLNSGNYVVVYGNMGPGGMAATNIVYPRPYFQKVTIEPYGSIELETSAIMCDPADTNSGIVNVELINNTILSPTTISLYATSNSATPIQSPIVLGASDTGATFTNVPLGNYFVRVTNACTTVERNITINTGSSGTLPIAKISRPKVCLSDNSTKLAITASSSLYDVTWTDANDSSNTVIGIGTPLTINPTATTTFRATFALKSSFNCVGNQTFTSDVVVEVTPNPDLTSAVAVSDIDWCLNTNRNFTISNSQSGFTYELTDANGVSFATPIKALSAGGNLVMTIPSSITLVAGNKFKVKVSNGSAGCSGLLTDVVSITSRQNNLNLDVISPTAMICLGTPSKITVVASEANVKYDVYKNGVFIATAMGTGVNLDFTILASQLSTGTNEFLISTSGSGCQNGILINKGIILVDKTPVISATKLTPLNVYGCNDVVAPAAVTTVTELETMGVTITDDTTEDSLLTVSSTDSPITGNTTTKYITRTYKITDSCNKFSTVIQNIVLNITTPTTPAISVGSSTTFCEGGSVVLTSSATSRNQWYRNNVAISGATSMTYTANQSGTYTVVVTNNYACSSPASSGVNVAVNSLPIATINNGTKLTFVNCSATTIDLTASNGNSFTWYYSPDNITAFSEISGAITQTITVSNLGFYKVKVVNSTNCEAMSQIQLVAAPSVAATQLETCVGNPIRLTADASSFVNPTYEWSKNGSILPSITTQNFDATEDGVYTVTVTDGRTTGNIGTQTSCGANLKFNPLPIVNAGTDFTITCATNASGFTIGETPETGFDYVWSSPNGISGLSNAIIANPIAHPTATTTYTVRKTNKTTLCWQEDSITITVDTTLPVANVGADFTKTCVDYTLGKEIGVAPISGVTYSWFPTTGLDDATKANPIANPATTTVYELTATNSANGCSAKDTVAVTLDVSAPTANAGADFTKTCVTNPTGKLIGAAAVSGTTYSWFPTTGLSDTTIANPMANPSSSSIYTLTTTSNVTGCTTRDVVNITVNTNLPTVNAGTDFTITCANNASGLTIGETPEAGFDYAWSSPNGVSGLTNAAIANPIAHPTATTTYTVRKTNQTTGCSQEDSITITVDTTLPLANAGTDFTKTCVDYTLGKEIGVAPISGVTYSWVPTIGLDDATIANPIANPATTTVYEVTVTNSINGCSSKDTVVANLDVSTPTANAGADFTKTCATNPTGKLIGATAVNGETYSWLPTTGLSDATSANPNANPSTTTLYTLTATKTATGCTTTASVTATVLDTPNPVALSTTIANNCPAETVDLSTIQPALASGIVYEWWTGTATSRGTQITNPITYATAGTVYLWSKTASEGCYNTTPSEVSVMMNVCCMPTVGQLVDTTNLTHFAPADITSLNHINYPIPSVVRYVIVNDLDGKIKQVNTAKPEFTQLPAGNYTVHALVFGTTVTPTGLLVGNKLSQVQPSCGISATFTIAIQSTCSSKLSFTEILPNAKQYALLDLSTYQFVQVNTTGIFTMVHTGLSHQVIAFNYTETANGIKVGGTLSGITAANLDVTAGSIIIGCTAVSTQIYGNIYNDKDKKCVEGLNNQEGLPITTLYAKLLNSSNQVIAVSSAIQAPGYTFSMSPDLLDDTYSILLDDNNSVSDAVATYPNSWKGNVQTFTVVSGQIIEHLSNTANFVPMCMQSVTNKPILKPTANLVGNTYNFCQKTTAPSISIDALPGATVNWYTQAVGGVAKVTPLIPNTSVVGTIFCYVSQTVNGAESDRAEVIIAVHALPEQPTAIEGNNFIAAGTTQAYSVVNSSSEVTYNWILPADWTGISTTKDISVVVGTKDSTIRVAALSTFGCVSPIQELAVRVVMEDDIEIYNSLSPNGDGENDVFRIRNIDFYPENALSIFNRWGIEVYRVNSYGQNDNFFKGFSDGRSTVSRDVELPEGTYFYTLTYKNTKGIARDLSGYLYIK